MKEAEIRCRKSAAKGLVILADEIEKGELSFDQLRSIFTSNTKNRVLSTSFLLFVNLVELDLKLLEATGSEQNI